MLAYTIKFPKINWLPAWLFGNKLASCTTSLLAENIYQVRNNLGVVQQDIGRRKKPVGKLPIATYELKNVSL